MTETAPFFADLQDGMKEEKWKFMQKYYHRGAFFQETTEDGMAEPVRVEHLSSIFTFVLSLCFHVPVSAFLKRWPF